LETSYTSLFAPQVQETTSSAGFEKALSDKPLVFVELYSTKCRKCFSLMGKYSSLAGDHAGDDDIVFVKVACDKVKVIIFPRFAQISEAVEFFK